MDRSAAHTAALAELQRARDDLAPVDSKLKLADSEIEALNAQLKAKQTEAGTLRDEQAPLAEAVTSCTSTAASIAAELSSAQDAAARLRQKAIEEYAASLVRAVRALLCVRERAREILHLGRPLNLGGPLPPTLPATPAFPRSCPHLQTPKPSGSTLVSTLVRLSARMSCGCVPVLA